MSSIIEIQCQRIAGKSPALPEYATCGSSGADIRACIYTPIDIQPGETVAIPTGIMMAVPAGFEAQIRPRSGLALNNRVILPNSPGTIDSDYRGEVKILMTNLGREPFVVKNGDRIAQIVICPVVKGEFRFTVHLSQTARGDGGFGHSGLE